jgi:hypothetical protein
MRARQAILFIALVVMATATFDDANAWLEPLPSVRALPIAARVAILYLPTAALVAILWLWGRIGPRVQGAMGWFAALALLSAATLYTTYATPVLMLASALVLLQLAPRVGMLYEARSFPSIRAFLGLTLLAAMSLKWGADIFGLDLVMERYPDLPLDGIGLAACAAAAAALIGIAGLRTRRVQPCSATLWLNLGLFMGIAGALTAHLPSAVRIGFFVSAALVVAGHVALFIGCFLLLSHLLPAREADHVTS